MKGSRMAAVLMAALLVCLVGLVPVWARASGPVERTSAHRTADEDVGESRAAVLTNRFWELLKYELEAAGVGMTSAGRSAAYKVISRGARRLAEGEASKEEVEQAEVDLRRFALSLVEAAKNQRGDEPVVDRGTVVQAKRGVCPLFPFC